MSLTLPFLLPIFLLGTFIGSFLNVVIWRLPREEKLTGRSHCPNCKHKLIWLDLIPVLSFVFYGAQCRYCNKKISWRYPLIEVIVGVLFVLAVLLVAPSSSLTLLPDWATVAKYAFILTILLVVFVIDFEHYLILNKIIYPAIAVVLIADFLIYTVFSQNTLSSYTFTFVDSLLGMIAGFLPFYLLWKISKGKWMGLGDAKFGLFLGAVFGFPQIWVCYFIAFLLGTVVAIPLLVTGKKQLSGKLPFGTFLAVAAGLTLWFGPALASWYLGLISLS